MAPCQCICAETSDRTWGSEGVRNSGSSIFSSSRIHGKQWWGENCGACAFERNVTRRQKISPGNFSMDLNGNVPYFFSIYLVWSNNFAPSSRRTNQKKVYRMRNRKIQKRTKAICQECNVPLWKNCFMLYYTK
jgi:hypothetical protein